ncbi:hypothetical protein ASG52_03700 [Methylobacterium sp. Leaf456]|uniref:hypothetical protein n=1 Tax=Methylobacterium sp. Leaf456 TaxID=1736382 RepID=UPI0006F99892|nr:hypothetical protein [Methylobacterium sp. Leaf456]KQT57178.1 hypothetical protein ASG52_03700 [Methylobacterium sp. Leaf456]
MAFNPFRQVAPELRAHVIRVTGGEAERFAVLAADSGQALAAVVAGLRPCDIAEVTGEVLAPAAAARLPLEPGRPLRLG